MVDKYYRFNLKIAKKNICTLSTFTQVVDGYYSPVQKFKSKQVVLLFDVFDRFVFGALLRLSLLLLSIAV